MPPLIPIRYDKGIYLPSVDFWLDPKEVSAHAFVSHAHSDHFAPHEHILCSKVTRSLIARRYGERGIQHFHTPDWLEPYESRGYQFRLLPAGHIFGSAMLHVTCLKDGGSLLYTGDFKLRQSLSSETFKLISAHTLVMESTFGLPKYRFPPTVDVVRQIIAFVHETLDDGGIPVLLGYSLGKAQEILAILSKTTIPVMLHSSVASLTRIYETLRGPLGTWKPFDAKNANGHVLIFPPSSRRLLALRKLERVKTAMLSGWALESGARFRYRVDEVFALSDHADYDELLECVAQVNPRRIYTVHGYASQFARDLRERGYDAWSLVSENQLEIPFPREITGPQATNLPKPEIHYSQGNEQAVDSFALWVHTCEKIAVQTSRLAKTQTIADYLQRLRVEDLPRATRWLAGNPSEPTLPDSLQVGHAVIRHALLTLSGMREGEYRRLAQSQNDAGRTAFLALQYRRKASGNSEVSVTLEDVSALFSNLTEAKGYSSKSQILQEMLRRLPPLEGSYVVRLLVGEMRIGSKEGLIEEAISNAFSESVETVREAAMLTGDIGRVAQLARSGHLAEAAPTLFVPLKVMLASPEESAEAIMGRFGEKML